MIPTPPNATTTEPSPAGGKPGPSPEPTRFIEWIDWLPWEKIVIWGLFLLVVYVLRHFFFIIFMTFILSYIMRSVVMSVVRLLSPRRERVWLEKGLTPICFALLLFGIYEAGNYFGPRLVAQAKALVERGTRLNPRQEFEVFTTKTVGAYIFQREYGSQGDPRYETAFEEYRRQDSESKAYDDFPGLKDALQDRFQEEERRRIQTEMASGPEADKEFEAWFLKEKAPAIFQAERDRLVEAYEKAAASAYKMRIAEKPLEELKKDPNYEKNRDESILQSILEREIGTEPTKRQSLRKEWEDRLVTTALAAFKDSPAFEEAFKAFYERQLASPALPLKDKPPYSYEKYSALREAYGKGPGSFLQALQESAPESEQARGDRERATFEYGTQQKLAKQFMDGEIMKGILANMTPYGEAALTSLTGWIRDGIGYLLTLPVQLALSLLLSFFITFDIPRIRAGILRLKQSRLSDFYDEIAPGLYNFGRLIGRAFQAQGVIAFFNTVLTFVAIQLIGIQNEIFLCTIVFVCSFIPVLGVVFSSIPIAIMAIIQPDGTVYKALQIIGAVLVIHFIETSILNPKILGDMLHLHPVLVLTVLAMGEHFAGIWGLLLGVPVAVYIIRCVILNEEIPGLIEQSPLAATAVAREQTGPPRGLLPSESSFVVEDGGQDGGEGRDGLTSVGEVTSSEEAPRDRAAASRSGSE